MDRGGTRERRAGPGGWPAGPAPGTAAGAAGARRAGRRRLDSAALFSGARELVIAHGEREYVLRITRHGKLILTS